MAARASWTGTIGFGMVSIGIGATPAVREQGAHFKQFREVKGKGGKVAMHPVGNKNYDKATDEIIPYEDIVKGFETESGVIVKVDEEELAALTPSTRSGHIEIEQFVADEVSELYFRRHEYLMPRKGSEKAYALMVAALVGTNRAGLGRVILRGKENMVLVRAVGGALLASFLYWDDEVRDTAELDIPAASVSEPEIEMAKAFVVALEGKWEPSSLVDSHRAKVVEVLEAKAAGKTLDLPAPSEHPKVNDLMAALTASVEKAKGGAK